MNENKEIKELTTENFATQTLQFVTRKLFVVIAGLMLILNECAELPQVLLMESVPAVHSQKNMTDFQKWIDFLESKGYSNYCSHSYRHTLKRFGGNTSKAFLSSSNNSLIGTCFL